MVRVSIDEAIELYVYYTSGHDVCQRFCDWWYWHECGIRDDETYIHERDADYVSKQEWMQERGITEQLIGNAERRILKLR